MGKTSWIISDDVISLASKRMMYLVWRSGQSNSSVVWLFIGFWQVGWVLADFGEGKFGGLLRDFLVLFLFIGWSGVFENYLYFRLNDHVDFVL